ncbi:hypothetical protein [Streptomyces sp. NPDC021608]|uniref:hypothetical protein n=1 Tax=Streptomyces sp. NPDC021608 TaxID=3154903 RepID=UPI0033E84B57
MSNTTPPPPDFSPPLPDVSPAPKKSRTNLVIIGSAAAVIAAVVATGIVVVQSSKDDARPATAAAASGVPDEDVVSAAADEPDPDPAYEQVDADSFAMKLRTTSRHCFGSAGCNVTVEPDLTYVGIADIDPSAVYEITYEIRGDTSGPVIETAELSNQMNLNYTPTSISTASSGTKVSVTITEVVAQGE